MNDWLDYTIHPVTGFELDYDEIYKKKKRLQVTRLMDKHKKGWVEDFYVCPHDRRNIMESGAYQKVFGLNIQES